MKTKHQMIRMIWDQWRELEQDHYLTTRGRWWYAFKASICLLLGREPSEDYFDGYYDDIVVAYYGERAGNYEYGGRDWEELHVGEGILRNWFVYEDTNGYP